MNAAQERESGSERGEGERGRGGGEREREGGREGWREGGRRVSDYVKAGGVAVSIARSETKSIN